MKISPVRAELCVDRQTNMAKLRVIFLSVMNTSNNVFCHMNSMKQMRNRKAIYVRVCARVRKFRLRNSVTNFK